MGERRRHRHATPPSAGANASHGTMWCALRGARDVGAGVMRIRTTLPLLGSCKSALVAGPQGSSESSSVGALVPSGNPLSKAHFSTLSRHEACGLLGRGMGLASFVRGKATLAEVAGAGTPSTDDMVAYAHETGVSPTNFALKHPTERISYDESGGPSKRAFTYLVLTGGRFIYAAGLRLLVLKFILSMQASKDVLALASLEVSLDAIEEGSTVTMKWRGKPVFIKHRTAAEIANANDVSVSTLRDPQTDEERVLEPKWLVLVGVCTHLGCVPLSDAGDYNGWFCPCHGSHYDVSGRIRKRPAPLNMEVPEYKFLEENKLLIG